MKPARDVLREGRALAALMEGRDLGLSAEPRKARVVPDYVSAETLARRLDCCKTTVHGYVRRGILPKPIRIGELVRWRWSAVEKAIESIETGPESHADDTDDPYLKGLDDRGSAEEADDHAPALRTVR